MSTTELSNDEHDQFPTGYQSAWERDYVCEDCGRTAKRTHAATDGADCKYWDCDDGTVVSQQTKRAVSRLMDGESETCIRLARYARCERGRMTTEDFLQPLIATEGEIVLRISMETGALWVWWAGTPLDKDFFKCVSALGSTHDHEVVGRRSGSPRRLKDTLKENRPTPIHLDNVPASVRAMMANDSPYTQLGSE